MKAITSHKNINKIKWHSHSVGSYVLLPNDIR